MSIAEKISERIAMLTPAQQKRVLDFVEAVGPGKSLPKGARLEDLTKFAGTISPEDLLAMEKAIEEACEQVDPDAW